MEKESELKFTVKMDENNLPQEIRWQANDGHESGISKSIMVALWDEKENNTLRIDLWTKTMSIDEMKKFYIQNILTLTDTYLRSTNDEATANAIKDYVLEVGKKTGVIA